VHCRTACLEVEAQQLTCMQLGQALSLADWAEQHAVRLLQCRQQLDSVYADAVSTAAAACERALAALQEEMLGAAGEGMSAVGGGADFGKAK